MSGTTDDTTTPDYLAQLAPILRQLQPPPAMPSGTPDDGTKPSWTGLLGRALSGGQAPGYQLRGSQADTSGNRALLNFGINMLLASGPHAVRPDVLSAAATGLQGAQESLGNDQQRAAQLAAAQQAYGQQQFQNRIAALKEAVPLLRMQAGAATPNALLGGGTGTTPAPVSGANATLPPGAYGQGGPNDVPVPKELLPLYQEASARTGIPVDVLIAQGRQESGFKADAVGKAGEIGLGQIKPSTAAAPGFGLSPVDPSKLKDPRTNINFQADYLKARLPPGANPNDPAAIRAALHGYNGGGDPNYVANVTRYLPAPAPPAAVGSAGPSAAPPGAPPPGAPPVASAAPPGATPATQFAGPGAPPPAAPSVVAPAQPGTAPIAAPGGPAAPTAGQTFEDFRAQHPIAVDPASYAVTPPDLANAKAAQMEAARQLTLSRQGLGGDPNKSLSDYNTATQNVAKLQQEAQAKSLELRQAAEKNALDTQRQLYDQEMTRQQQAQLKAQELAQQAAEAEKQRAAAVDLETQRGNQQIELEKVKAGQTYHQKLQEQAATYAQDNTLKPMSAQAAKAHQMNLGLSQLLPVIQDLPKGGGALGAVLDAHPDLAPLFNTAGILNDKQADAVRLVNGLVSNISTEMKPQGLGALREYEWDAFKAQLPSLLSTPAGQQKAVAMLMNMNDRIAQESSWMSSYFSRKVPDETGAAKPGAMVPAHNLESDNPKESVQQRMDRELGPIIPSYSGPLTASGQAQWEQSLPPGKPYYKTYAVPDPQNPSQPKRDSRGNVVTTKTLEIRPW